MASGEGLSVAVTGPTGTFGFGLMPLLEAEPRIDRVVGVARREFDPGAHGWSKLEYRRGDVRDLEGLRGAFEGCEVVVHLAFMITGTEGSQATREVNVEGTLNALRAARDAGARRFVYASSVAAYGFHDENPVGMDEDWPTRPARHLFYAREKAQVERIIREEAARIEGGPELYVLRPPIVLGPHAAGAKGALLDMITALARQLSRISERLPLPVPAVVPELELQLIHEDDVAEALLRCVLAEGPPGTYNIAADDTPTLPELARVLGLKPLGVPAAAVGSLAAAVAAAPGLPPTLQWAEALTHPAVMDTGRAKRELGWSPRHSALDALRDTLSTDRS